MFNSKKKIIKKNMDLIRNVQKELDYFIEEFGIEGMTYFENFDEYYKKYSAICNEMNDLKISSNPYGKNMLEIIEKHTKGWTKQAFSKYTRRSITDLSGKKISLLKYSDEDLDFEGNCVTIYEDGGLTKIFFQKYEERFKEETVKFEIDEDISEALSKLIDAIIAVNIKMKWLDSLGKILEVAIKEQ